MHEGSSDSGSSQDSFNTGGQYAQHGAAPSSRVVYCTNCGVQLDGLRIGEPCPNCQAPVGSSGHNNTKTSGKSVAALVLGICSIVSCILYGLPGLVCGILAIVFASKVRRAVAAGEISPSSLGMANAGRVCGIVGVGLSTLFMIAIVVWFVFVFSVMVPQQQRLHQQLQQQIQTQHQIQQQQILQGQPAPAQPAPDSAEQADTTDIEPEPAPPGE